MKIPRPLLCVPLLEAIAALDAQLGASGACGSFAIRFHYGPRGERKAVIECVGQEFDLAAGEAQIGRSSENRQGQQEHHELAPTRNGLTPGEDRP